MRKRPRQRRARGVDDASSSAFALARQHTLCEIADGDRAQVGAAVARLSLDPAWDGHRVLVTRAGDDVRLATADFRDWTATFPRIARAVGALPARRVALDGFLCLLDERGRPSFERLRARVAEGRAVTDAVLIAWDLLHLDDAPIDARNLDERRARLASLVAGAAPTIVASQELAAAPSLEALLASLAEVGLRGVVARPRDAPYPAAGAAPSWLALSSTTAPIAWRRSLSPPPPSTNRDKVLFPRDGITKAEIAAYYDAVAPILLQHLRDRPVVCQRWPDGIDEFTWYQHRPPPRAPDYLRAVWVGERSSPGGAEPVRGFRAARDGVRRILLDNRDALAFFVNQAALTFHTFASRVATLASPDWVVLDLDSGERTTWADVVEVALALRQLLELLALPSVVKTSGQRGLHILVPLAPGQTFAEADRFATTAATMIARLLPAKVTLELEIEKRGGRLLVDHRQFLGKTLVAPYSLRAVDGAPVSTPLAWDEVTPRLAPRAFTLRTLRARLDRLGDLAAPLLSGTARLPLLESP